MLNHILVQTPKTKITGLSSYKLHTFSKIKLVLEEIKNRKRNYLALEISTKEQRSIY